MTLTRARGSFLALAAAFAGWAGSVGCATAPEPMVDPGFAARAYAPARVALLPPDVFMVVDQVGDNDPAQSAALGQAVSAETVRAVEQALRVRGYDVDLSARWDGIFAQDGSVLVNRDELGWMANSILQFANGRAGSGTGTMVAPVAVAPELAARVGWATQSDALLYVNIKGVTTTPGKRTASVLAAVFFVVIVAAIVLALVASSKNGGGGGGGPNIGSGSGWRGAPVGRAPVPSGGGFRGMPVPAPGGRPPIPSGGGWRGTPPGVPGPAPLPGAARGGGWRGGGPPPPLPPGGFVYGGPHVNVGVGVIIPLDAPVYTHDGSIGYDDPLFGEDELYVSMTMVSTYDGRVLWHARDHLDLEADDSTDVDRMVESFLGTLPARNAPPPTQQTIRK